MYIHKGCVAVGSALVEYTHQTVDLIRREV